MKIVEREGCWPTPIQHLLLRACLGEGGDAVSAWLEWRAAKAMDDLDLGSFRLLPLLYHNLRRLDVKDPSMDVLKGTYRRAWVENQLLFHSVGPLLRRMAGAGIPLLLMKGVRLAHGFYQEPGLRPMRDVDFLVPEERFAETLALIGAGEWRSITFRVRPRLDNIPPWRHSLAFADRDGREFDLHRHALWQACYDGADGDFWMQAEVVEFQGVQCRALNPTDQLLQVCASGIEWNPVPPVRWVADAIQILRGARPIDWDRLAGLAERLRVILAARAALCYLRESFDVAIPEAVLARLDRTAVSLPEIRSFERWSAPQARRSPWDALLALWGLHLHAFRHRALPVRLLKFPAFLRYHWCLDRRHQVFLSACRWLWRWITWS